jgi:hypothetical protein
MAHRIVEIAELYAIIGAAVAAWLLRGQPSSFLRG